MPVSSPWIRWPSRQCWCAFFRYGALLTLLWTAVYGGASWITSIHQHRVRLHFDVELTTPFVPAAAVVYLSLFPMIWMSPFVLQTAQLLRQFAKGLAWLFILSGVGFVLLPSEEVQVHTVQSNIFGRIFNFADWINLSHNHLPCLHVGMAVLCAYAYAGTAPLFLVRALWAWAAAIALSTLITHQHYVADVIAGGALGYAIAWITFSICSPRR